MINFMLLAAVQPTVPDTLRWSWTGTGIIVGVSLFILFIAGRTIRYPQVGPKMPLPFPSLFNNPSVGTFLAAMSFGHILGIGAVLGLTNIGVLK